MTKEKWVQLKCDKFPNLNKEYEISNLGNVRSATTKKEVKRYFNSRVGYYQVRLYSAGEGHTVSIHRQVALAWIDNPKPEEYNVVNHKDEDKTNNRADNLEWCDQYYNMNYGTVNDRISEHRLNRDDSKKVPIIVTNQSTSEVQKCLSVRGAERLSGIGRGVINNRLAHSDLYTDSAKSKNTGVVYSFKYKDDKRILNGKTYDLDPNFNHGIKSAFRRKTADEVQTEISKVRPNLIMMNKQEYDDKELASHDKAHFKCTDCGNEFDMEPNSITSSKYNCPACSLRIRSEKHTVSRGVAQERFDKLFNGNIKLGEDYTQYTQECTMTCQNCGYEFKSVPMTLFGNGSKEDYQGNGCQHCSKSRYRTISNLKRYGHSDEEIKQALIKKGLTWNMNF